MDVQALRKNRTTDYEKITESFVQNGEQKSYKDDRFWKLDRDKAGNAYAIIRFLPKSLDDKSAFVLQYDHGFQGPTGRWYIEKSLTTIGEKDPVMELNSKHWNSGLESDKDIARKQKRRVSYICNILVISDPKHPENDGQVKLFKFGKKIYDMIMDKAFPDPAFGEQQKIRVWDIFDGANFRIKIRQDGLWPSYDKSEFDSQSIIFNGDNSIWAKEMVETPKPEDMYLKRQYPLSEFLDRKNFKTYEELSRKLAEVLNMDVPQATTAFSLSENIVQEAPKFKSTPAPTPAKSIVVDDDDDDVLNYFKSIADSD